MTADRSVDDAECDVACLRSWDVLGTAGREPVPAAAGIEDPAVKPGRSWPQPSDVGAEMSQASSDTSG